MRRTSRLLALVLALAAAGAAIAFVLHYVPFTAPDGIRVVFDLRVVPEADGVVRVSTETRCLANGDEARRTFAGYWRLIYPGSAIIRRVWLDAIVDRAVRDAEASL